MSLQTDNEFLPLATPNLAGNEQRYLNECVASTFVSSVGEFVTRFEQESAQALGALYGAAVSSGTAALHLGLLALGVRPGDLVIMPSFTFIATANAVAHAGASPWLMDVDPLNWTLDPELLVHELREHASAQGDVVIHRPTGKRIGAILPVHTLGSPADMDAINSIAREYGLPVLADGAACLGAKYKGRDLGSLADLTTLSFNGNKTVTAGGGGVVASDDQALVDHARHLSTQAKTGPGYRHDHVGYNYRLTNLQAAVGCAQLEQLTGFVERKRAIHRTYNQAWQELEGWEPFPEPAWAKSACWFSGVVCPDAATASALRDHLAKSRIAAGEFWTPVHLQTPYMNCAQSHMGVCTPLWPRIVVLPCSTHLTGAQQQRVINAVLDAYQVG
ncbi:MAG: aminotransferase class I/II-fold pyridoxal phosphate-dependent enzyme [Desulfovibrio sp.]|nr:MAG: aminotransferase class I/II-fold pyridoxal phosphate-dependent enzyme [Desulfovibrio sp.]